MHVPSDPPTPAARVEIDVLVVGGGPAGLAGALMLGRCRRAVLVCDDGRQRNKPSRALHGYPTRDGCAPSEWLRAARDELAAYPTVERVDGEVVALRRDGGRFEFALRDGRTGRARRVLLATGVCDELPDVPGFAECYGTSAFHCPYCDAFEVRDRPLAAYGRGTAAYGLALELRAWSADVVLCTDGTDELSARQLRALASDGIAVERAAVLRLDARDGRLERVVFEGGVERPCAALFFATGQARRTRLGRDLGCALDRRGVLRTRSHERTTARGVYVAGDASGGEQLVVVAAAEGTRAAIALHRELAVEDRRRRAR